MRRAWLALVVLAVYGLHQDFWWWKEYRPLLFGFLPVGLAYHAAYCLLAALLMAALVRLAWPAHLETAETPSPATAPPAGGRPESPPNPGRG